MTHTNNRIDFGYSPITIKM